MHIFKNFALLYSFYSFYILLAYGKLSLKAKTSKKVAKNVHFPKVSIFGILEICSLFHIEDIYYVCKFIYI